MYSECIHSRQRHFSNFSLRALLKSARAMVVVLATLLLSHSSVYAQFDSATVLGTITDPSGASVPTATVQLLDPVKGVIVTRQTDGDGNYEFTNVHPGEYSITVSAGGFEMLQTDRFTGHGGRPTARFAGAETWRQYADGYGFRSRQPA
jgi:hypothetical protein